MKKDANSLQSIIYRHYLTSSLVPIFAIEMVLLILYFGINLYISQKNQETLRWEVILNLEEITSREVANINNQLKEISRYAVMMQSDHERFFTGRDNCRFHNGEADFGFHENGVYYKIQDNGGASLYYSSSTPMGEDERKKASCSEILDPLLISIVNNSPIVTQAYFNTRDGMNRLYPFMADAPGQYGPVLHMEEYNFYYEADARHNPKRKPVWTGAYLDPAGQGWMVSNIVPIYNGNFLEGVSGLDVTIDRFIQSILDLDIPWDAGAFMVDGSGMILAMPEKVEQLLGLKELKAHVYKTNISQTVKKPDAFNILKNKNPAIRSQMKTIFESKQHISALSIGEKKYLLSQEIVEETGWRMITLVDEARVFAPVFKLKALSDKIGYYAIGVMLAFYILFFLFLQKKSHRLASTIAAPIETLSQLTSGMGNDLNLKKIASVGISEVDALGRHFNQMADELEARTVQLVETRSNERVKTRELKALNKLAVLLNNSNEGYLSFDENLIVEPEYSQACEDIFEKQISGRLIVELLYPDMQAAQDSLSEGLTAVFKGLSREDDSAETRQMISDLPREFFINDACWAAKYRLLDSGRMMMILKDISVEKELILSEKMASLGQLVAGVAHEINTPIGAIKSCGGTIAECLKQAMDDLPVLLREYPASVYESFWALFQAYPPAAITNREERGLTRKLTLRLSERAVKSSREWASILVRLGVHTDPEKFEPLFNHERSDFLLRSAGNILAIFSSTETINLSGHRVEKIVYALKSFSHHSRSSEKIEADVIEGLETVLTVYHNQIKHNIELVREYEPIPPILCYPDELNQVWTNLIHNALQAMSYNGVLTIGTQTIDGHVQVLVKDTGCGIPKDQQSKIFQPFYTTKIKGEGTGLGLDIVKKVIDRHDGSITLESRPGIGSSFFVLLPIDQKTSDSISNAL